MDQVFLSRELLKKFESTFHDDEWSVQKGANNLPDEAVITYWRLCWPVYISYQLDYTTMVGTLKFYEWGADPSTEVFYDEDGRDYPLTHTFEIRELDPVLITNDPNEQMPDPMRTRNLEKIWDWILVSTERLA